MRRSTLAITAALALGAVSSASAADIPAPVYKAPVAVPLYNWSGIYVGLFAGGLWADKDWTFISGPSTGHTADGFIGGAQIGVNWQTGPWVFGLQLDWGWTGADGSSLCPDAAFTCSTEVKHLGSITGRIGYAWNALLLYVKGGGAWTEDDFTAVGPSTFTGSSSPWGWTIGGGLEYGFAPNWSVFVEYDYYDFGSERIAFVDGAGVRDDFNVDQTVNVFKAGINYRFNWLRP